MCVVYVYDACVKCMFVLGLRVVRAMRVCRVFVRADPKHWIMKESALAAYEERVTDRLTD